MLIKKTKKTNTVSEKNSNKRNFLYVITFIGLILLALTSYFAFEFGKNATSEQIGDATIIYYSFIITLFTLFIYAVYKINKEILDKRKRKDDNTISF
jgi:heme/copper-type cytochrome/quinol oxidase subunit 2